MKGETKMIGSKARAVFLFLLVMVFAVLLAGGYMIDQNKPPIPKTVIGPDGMVVYTAEDVMAGQNYYFSRGGQHIGSIWGHGSYLAPDWSADYLHRMGLYIAARHQGKSAQETARFSQADFDALDQPTQARLSAEVASEIKMNRYDASTDSLVLTPYQTEAHRMLIRYYTDLFKNGHEGMGLQPGIVRTDEQGARVTAFFGWLSWAAGTQRPDEDYTYTSNWPFDPLVGNRPMPGTLIWSIVSVMLLILFTALMTFIYLRYVHESDYSACEILPFSEPNPTPSQVATLSFFLVAAALLCIQILMGVVTGHFKIEGTSFFGIPLGGILPYAITRTWHVQLAIFFIAACFLGAGLFIGPFVGKEPKAQSKLVWLLFFSVVVVVVGTLVGTWLSVTGMFGGDGFYFGHQGYEYIELGRVWQLLLIGGMVLWLVLVRRAILPALKSEEDKGGLNHMLLYSAVAIPLFYMAGLMYGKDTHVSMAEYWRWWVVHLWVEGFFEVFATVVMGFLMAHIGAVSRRAALTAIYFIIFLYLGAGVIGTFHHLYWSGTPTPIIALGAVFSALEVVPLTLLGFEVVRNLYVLKIGGWNYPYKWPIYFFISVSFWNLVGAGIFGFLINPPIVLYYIQGTNTTALHSHTALFGVYGLLSVSLMLFAMRNIVRMRSWSDKLLKWCFVGLNGGLAGMTVFSLIPSGFYQFYFAVKHGLWYARSPEIASGPVISAFAWARIAPDIVFAAGAILLLVFVGRAIWLTFIKKVPALEGDHHWQPPERGEA
jgi:nitric oxide reductase subunit B